MKHGAHILLISFTVKGHINPTIQLAKRLIRLGANVVFVTTATDHHQFGTVVKGLSITSFSDAPDDDENKPKSADDYISLFRKKGSQKIKEIITSSTNQGRPITCVVYAHLLPWAGDVARSFEIPSVLLWIQPAATLDIYYHYIKGYGNAIRDTANDPSLCVELPGLPRLASRDLPSFLLPTCSSEYSSFIPSFEEQILALDAETNPRVFVNTFEELEPEVLKAIRKYNIVGIGPLIPSEFLDQKDLSECDLFQESSGYVEWLNSQPKSSVIYIAFGSMLELSKEQVEEIAYGLLESERPFLWVIKNIGEELKEALSQKGMIVPWCSQLEVLSHPSMGCFITHCGWNSTIESLAMGVPVVAFPQWTDQPTNAKLIEDVWKIGVRVSKGAKTDDGKEIVDRKEVKRCIEMVMGEEEKSEELRRNAMKWKDLARGAVMDGGTSDINLKAFVEEVGGAN